MPLFRHKPTEGTEIVDAERFSDQSKPPRGVRCDDAGMHVVAKNGRRLNVKLDDWIISDGDGVHFFQLEDDVFQRNFDPI